MITARAAVLPARRVAPAVGVDPDGKAGAVVEHRRAGVAALGVGSVLDRRSAERHVRTGVGLLNLVPLRRAAVHAVARDANVLAAHRRRARRQRVPLSLGLAGGEPGLRVGEAAEVAPVVAHAAVDRLHRGHVHGVLVLGARVHDVAPAAGQRHVELDDVQRGAGAVAGGEKAVLGVADEPHRAADGHDPGRAGVAREHAVVGGAADGRDRAAGRGPGQDAGHGHAGRGGSGIGDDLDLDGVTVEIGRRVVPLPQRRGRVGLRCAVGQRRQAERRGPPGLRSDAQHGAVERQPQPQGVGHFHDPLEDHPPLVGVVHDGAGVQGDRHLDLLEGVGLGGGLGDGQKQAREQA